MAVYLTKIDPEADPVYTQRVIHCEAIGFGKEAPGASYPAIYIYGTVNGVKGIWQSIDEARSWVLIDDDRHQFGDLSNGNFVRGDANIFGVVYRSTAGRGIAVRYPFSVSTVQKNNRPGTSFHIVDRRINSGYFLCNYTLDGRLVSRIQVNRRILSIPNSSRKVQGVTVSVLRDNQNRVLKTKKVQTIRGKTSK